jgi:hypothetical protein
MDIVTMIILKFVAVLGTVINGLDGIIIMPEAGISALDLIIGFAIAYDVLIFYRRLTDNPVSIADMFNDYKTGKQAKNMSMSEERSRLIAQGQRIRESYVGKKDYPEVRMK